MRRSKAAITLSAGLAAAVLTPWGCSRAEKRPGKGAAEGQAPGPVTDPERAGAKVVGNGGASKHVSESAGLISGAAPRGRRAELPGKPPEAPEPEPSAEAERRQKRPRVLWKVETTGGRDFFAQLVPAGETLLAVRAGVLYAFDAGTGQVRWRFPEHGVMAKVKNLPQAHFVLGVLGDRVVTKLPGNLAGGVQELHLADGALLRTLDTRADLDFPTPEFPHAGGVYHMLAGRQIAFSGSSDELKRTQVCVFDLEKWREEGRFEIPESCGNLFTVNGRVLGFFRRRKEEKFARAFSVDLARGEAFSLPVRTNHSSPEAIILPDGSRLVHEGRVSPKCAYDGYWPWMTVAQVHAVGERVFVVDPYGLARVDPRDGRELWRLPLPPAKFRFNVRIAGDEDALAVAVGNYVHLIDAEKGTSSAAMRVFEGFKTASERRRCRYWMHLACGGGRAYFSWAKGLAAFSTHPVQRNRPDPGDPADPAFSIAKCREAASRGDFEAALKAIHESSVSVLLRPGCREEFAGLLSQLSRSPAPETLPGFWTDVLLADGWICGELFLDEYGKLLGQPATERRAASSLYAMGGKPALAFLSQGLDKKPPTSLLPYAARARWKLTGKRPLDELAARNDIYEIDHLLDPPLDEAEFRRFLPTMRGKKKTWLEEYVRRIPPEWCVALLEDNEEGKSLGHVAAAAREQVESRARGEGAREEIEITGAGTPPAEEEF